MSSWLLFGLFGFTLLGIALVHKRALQIALGGSLAVICARLLLPTPAEEAPFDLAAHLQHEWPTLANLFALLVGFALLADLFERSRIPHKLTVWLPTGRLGAFLLLAIVAVISSVLDNIAAALIGGTAAMTLFRGNLHVGYLAAIVAASNAGGSGSVVGDTTTTMIWLSGVSPMLVAEAAVGAIAALLFFGWFAARQQHQLQPLVRTVGDSGRVDVACVAVVVLILVGAIAGNIAFGFPAVGVWAALLLGALVRKPAWKAIPAASLGAVFLLSLVLAASMMPVKSLPEASPGTAFGLGLVSAFFDNIPLTRLALAQNGYDWGFLAFCVGYGGSMLWFGSSAGVAIAGVFPQAKSAKDWLKGGWHVAVGYVLGSAAMMVITGWNAYQIPRSHGNDAPAGHTAPAGGPAGR